MDTIERLSVVGKFYPEQSSQCVEVDIVMDMVGQLFVYVYDHELVGQFDRAQLNISDKIGRTPREIVIEKVGLIVIDSAPDIDAWLSQNRHNDRLWRLEKSSRFVVLSCLLVPAFLYGFFKYMIPVGAVIFADLVPESVVDVASNHTMKAMEYKILQASELPQVQQDELRQSMLEVIERLPNQERHFRILFHSAPEMGANAFALPNGTIVFTDEFVNLVEGDRDMLIAVLLHELGHIEYKHSMRLIAETLASAMAIDFFLGDIGGSIEFFAGMTNTIVQNQFSQDLEWEADNYALTQLEALGKSREDFARAMEKLAMSSSNESNLEALLSSHPSLKQRIMNARGQGQD